MIKRVTNTFSGAGVVVITCGTMFETLEELDEHVERIHMGQDGLREIPAAVRVYGLGVQPPTAQPGAAAARTAVAATLAPPAHSSGQYPSRNALSLSSLIQNKTNINKTHATD